MNKDLTLIEKQISPITTQAEAIDITSPDHMVVATEVLSRLNQLNDTVTAKRETITKPLNESLKAARAMFKPLESQLTDAIQTIRTKMSAYQTAQMAQIALQEARIAARVEKGTLGINKAVAKLDELQRPDAITTTLSGSLTFRPKNTLRITNDTIIPRQYLLPDEATILAALLDGVGVPGCEVEVIQVPYNKR
jgi:hypothetical protein